MAILSDETRLSEENRQRVEAEKLQTTYIYICMCIRFHGFVEKTYKKCIPLDDIPIICTTIMILP